MIYLNGEKNNNYNNSTISNMLKEENYESLKVVVEINEEIIPRDSFDTYLIKDGDTVEVLSFVGGG